MGEGLKAFPPSSNTFCAIPPKPSKKWTNQISKYLLSPPTLSNRLHVLFTSQNLITTIIFCSFVYKLRYLSHGGDEAGDGGATLEERGVFESTTTQHHCHYQWHRRRWLGWSPATTVRMARRRPRREENTEFRTIVKGPKRKRNNA